MNATATPTRFDIAQRPDQVPAAAGHFNLPGNFDFQLNQERSNKVPFSMLARSVEPVEHHYWGRCVHDFDGMTVAKESIVVDYKHDQFQVMGAANTFDVADQGLVVGGYVVRKPNNPPHIANEVLENAAAGVPYEASIYFDYKNDILVEFVDEGEVSQVNGGTFEGPGVIFRRWTLKAVSICPHGYDCNARSNFELSDQPNTLARLTYTEEPMTTKATKPASDPKAAKKPNQSTAGANVGQLSDPNAEAAAAGKPEAAAEAAPDPMAALLKRIEALESAKSETEFSEPETPKDPTAELLKRIEALESAGSFSADQDPTAEAIGQLSEKLDQAIAGFAHFNGSSGAAAGAGEGGEPKPTFRSFIKKRK